MKLWSGVLSTNAAKVRIAILEKGLSAEILEVPWSREKRWYPKPEAFLEASPRAEVPVLIDDGLVIHDSTVINEYLNDQYPEINLIPGDSRNRVQVRLWEDEADNLMNKAVTVLIQEVFMQGGDAERIAEANLAIKGYLGRLNQQLENEGYICGDFSLADIATILTLAFAQTLGVAIPDGKVLNWYNRTLARPVIQAEYQAILASAAAA